MTQGLAKVGEGREQLVSVEHPSGEFSVAIQRRDDGSLAGSGLLRTARLLFVGEVLIPAAIWPAKE